MTTRIAQLAKIQDMMQVDRYKRHGSIGPVLKLAEKNYNFAFTVTSTPDGLYEAVAKTGSANPYRSPAIGRGKTMNTALVDCLEGFMETKVVPVPNRLTILATCSSIAPRGSAVVAWEIKDENNEVVKEGVESHIKVFPNNTYLMTLVSLITKVKALYPTFPIKNLHFKVDWWVEESLDDFAYAVNRDYTHCEFLGKLEEFYDDHRVNTLNRYEAWALKTKADTELLTLIQRP